MTVSKVQFSLGSLSFSGEGEEGWVEKQLDKVIEKAPVLSKCLNEVVDCKTSSEDSLIKQEDFSTEKFSNSKSLSYYIKEKNVSNNQVKKFLATALFLQDYKGKQRMKTNDIVEALKNANQSKLTNPSQKLSNNVQKGYIEKDGNSFYVTDQGRESL